MLNPLIISICVCLCAAHAEATERETVNDSCGDNASWTVNNSILTISGSGDITSHPWTEKFTSSIESVVFKGNLTSIPECAFSGCNLLTTISIPSTITTISDEAFSSCTQLKFVSISDGVSSFGENVFSGCVDLLLINVSENNLFFKDIEGVLFNKDVSHLLKYPAAKDETFYEIPGSVVSIDGDAFGDCWKLKSVSIHTNVTSIHNQTFRGCNSLESINVDKNNQEFKSVDGVLLNKEGSKLIRYPTGKKDTSYIIPDSVKSIEFGAFHASSFLREITIPTSVTTIHQQAFFGCSKLEIVSYLGVTDPCLINCSSAFANCGISAICVPLEYNSSFFCGLDHLQQRGAVEDIENQCFHAKCVDGGFNATKRADALNWESNSNGCVEYYCDNKTGLKTKSICSSNVCVGGECKKEGKKIEKDWVVNITIDHGLQELNIGFIIETLCNYVGKSCDILKQFVVLEINDEGQILNLIVYLDDKTIAEKIADYIKRCK